MPSPGSGELGHWVDLPVARTEWDLAVGFAQCGAAWNRAEREAGRTGGGGDEARSPTQPPGGPAATAAAAVAPSPSFYTVDRDEDEGEPRTAGPGAPPRPAAVVQTEGAARLVPTPGLVGVELEWRMPVGADAFDHVAACLERPPRPGSLAADTRWRATRRGQSGAVDDACVTSLRFRECEACWRERQRAGAALNAEGGRRDDDDDDAGNGAEPWGPGPEAALGIGGGSHGLALGRRTYRLMFDASGTGAAVPAADYKVVVSRTDDVFNGPAGPAVVSWSRGIQSWGHVRWASATSVEVQIAVTQWLAAWWCPHRRGWADGGGSGSDDDDDSQEAATVDNDDAGDDVSGLGDMHVRTVHRQTYVPSSSAPDAVTMARIHLSICHTAAMQGFGRGQSGCGPPPRPAAGPEAARQWLAAAAEGLVAEAARGAAGLATPLVRTYEIEVEAWPTCRTIALHLRRARAAAAGGGGGRGGRGQGRGGVDPEWAASGAAMEAALGAVVFAVTPLLHGDTRPGGGPGAALIGPGDIAAFAAHVARRDVLVGPLSPGTPLPGPSVEASVRATAAAEAAAAEDEGAGDATGHVLWAIAEKTDGRRARVVCVGRDVYAVVPWAAAVACPAAAGGPGGSGSGMAASAAAAPPRRKRTRWDRDDAAVGTGGGGPEDEPDPDLDLAADRTRAAGLEVAPTNPTLAARSGHWAVYVPGTTVRDGVAIESGKLSGRRVIGAGLAGRRTRAGQSWSVVRVGTLPPTHASSAAGPRWIVFDAELVVPGGGRRAQAWAFDVLAADEAWAKQRNPLQPATSLADRYALMLRWAAAAYTPAHVQAAAAAAARSAGRSVEAVDAVVAAVPVGVKWMTLAGGSADAASPLSWAEAVWMAGVGRRRGAAAVAPPPALAAWGVSAGPGLAAADDVAAAPGAAPTILGPSRSGAEGEAEADEPRLVVDPIVGVSPTTSAGACLEARAVSAHDAVTCAGLADLGPGPPGWGPAVAAWAVLAAAARHDGFIATAYSASGIGNGADEPVCAWQSKIKPPSQLTVDVVLVARTVAGRARLGDVEIEAWVAADGAGGAAPRLQSTLARLVDAGPPFVGSVVGESGAGARASRRVAGRDDGATVPPALLVPPLALTEDDVQEAGALSRRALWTQAFLAVQGVAVEAGPGGSALTATAAIPVVAEVRFVARDEVAFVGWRPNKARPNSLSVWRRTYDLWQQFEWAAGGAGPEARTRAFEDWLYGPGGGGDSPGGSGGDGEAETRVGNAVAYRYDDDKD